ncbi:hypothetical protein ABT144_14470 [Streptomyces sp. NPDC002039]|uniref:hypothetical protein n=1 Tax=Streptomyces sp. NPDC002039 TaxID=3154660 RepID=UPI00332A6A1B
MSITEQQQQSQPRQSAPQASGTDPVLVVVVGLVVVLFLAGTGYLCVAHPALTAAVGAVAGVGAALVAVLGVAVALRQR